MAVSFANDEHDKATKVELTNEQTGNIIGIDTSKQTVTVKAVST